MEARKVREMHIFWRMLIWYSIPLLVTAFDWWVEGLHEAIYTWGLTTVGFGAGSMLSLTGWLHAQADRLTGYNG